MIIEWKREAGRKPNKSLLSEAGSLARSGTKDHLVVSMAMRPNGVTQREVVSLLGHPHRNKLRQLLRDNRVRQFVLPDGSRSQRIRIVKR